jgi:hypothetical protein
VKFDFDGWHFLLLGDLKILVCKKLCPLYMNFEFKDMLVFEKLLSENKLHINDALTEIINRYCIDV